VPPGARVLDVAAGRGRHARLFAQRGARVLAVDVDAGALAAMAGVPGIEVLTADLEHGQWPLPDQRFDAIVVTNYLHRPLFACLRAALAADGVLLYETFALGNEAFGRPSNPDFLLCPGELLSLAALPADPMTVVAFEQGLSVEGDRRTVVQRLAAVGAAHAWPMTLRA
jgi:SAM-dependent methyltransferase